MYALKNIFSSLLEKVKPNSEKKPIYTDVNIVNVNVNVNVNTNKNRDYATFDHEIISRTEYLLKNKS
jgi:hypothetical protein